MKFKNKKTNQVFVVVSESIAKDFINNKDYELIKEIKPKKFNEE